MNIARVSFSSYMHIVSSSHARSVNAVHTIFISEYWTLNTFWLRVLHGLCAFVHSITIAFTLFIFVFVRRLFRNKILFQCTNFIIADFFFRFLCSCINAKRFLSHSFAFVFEPRLRLDSIAAENGKKYIRTFFYFVEKKGTECHMHLSRKFSLKMWMESKMENGKFYYVRLSAWVCVYSIFFHFASDMCMIVVITWSAYKIIISIFGSIVCIRTYCHPFYFSNVRMCDGRRVVTAYATAMDVVRIVHITTDFR